MKRTVLFFALLLPGLLLWAKEITVHVESAGTLESYINASEKLTITKATISGQLNGTDIRCIREMAGKTAEGTDSGGILQELDLSGASIVEGGTYYYYIPSYPANMEYYTKNNVCPSFFLLEAPHLRRMVLPASIEEVGHNAFEGCVALEHVVFSEGLTQISSFAFRNCPLLASLDLPTTLKIIDIEAFRECTSLTEVVLPEKLEKYFPVHFTCVKI